MDQIGLPRSEAGAHIRAHHLGEQGGGASGE